MGPRQSRAQHVRVTALPFEEASTVFYDDYARQFFDEDHSDDEERFLMLGLSNRSRVLMVVHCEREGQEAEPEPEPEPENKNGTRNKKEIEDKIRERVEPTIRIISARKATAAERAFYDGPLP